MATRESALTIEPVSVGEIETESQSGPCLLARFLDTASTYIRVLGRRVEDGELPQHAALFGRMRGTGPGVSLTRLVDRLRSAFPIPLESPFEESPTVAGAVLEGRELIARDRNDAMLILQFDAGSSDLPMHAHLDSDRFIYVVGGRGAFHVSTEAVEEFSGEGIRHVPVRASDVVMFTRGTVHTFSTECESLLLLSCHAPYVPLEDPRQYAVPARRVCPGATANPKDSRIAGDAAWLCVA